MTTAAVPGADFDYCATVFGDQDLIARNRRSWAAVRMRRCLESLADVTGQVLEVGCGAGRCIRTIRHHRPDLAACGCDLSQSAIDAARRHRDGVVYQRADAAELPYADQTFDAVVVMDLIEHVPDVPAVLAEIRRVCKPGGRLHLHVPCEGSWLSVYRPLLMLGIDLTQAAVGHLQHLTRRQVLEHLASAGFVVTRRRYSMYFFGQVHDLITWWSMLRPGGKGIAGAAPAGRGEAAPAPVPTSRRFRFKHLLTRPLWWAIRRSMPGLQYLELAALSWQPLGSVGLCVTARRGS